MTGRDRCASGVSRDELLAAMPPDVRAALVTEPWLLSRLWGLDLPTCSIPLTDFDWLLDLPLWQRDGVRFQVSPRQVFERPEEWPHHLRRAQRADLAYPIHVMRRGGRWTVLDGFHRLVRARLEGLQEVCAMVLDEEDLAMVCAPR